MHARAKGVELLGEMAGSGYTQAPLLVRRGDGQTIQLTPLLYCVLDALDGERNSLEIAWDVARATDKVLSASEVDYLIEEKLRPLGLVTDELGNEPAHQPRSNPLLALKLRFVVTNPKITNRITAPFALLFHPAIAIPMVTAFVAITGWVLFTKGLGSAIHETIYDPRFLLLTFALTILSAGFHEFGHAAAAKYGGATPGAMGAAIYLVWPAFYTDVTDSYRLDRRGRLRVDVGGLYFNAIFAVATFVAWLVTRHDSLLVMVPIQLFQMVRQLLPFVRFDGYHILADLTGVPDLFSRIVPTLKGLLPNHWHDPQTKVLKPWARAAVTLWTLAVIPALAACLVLLILGLPRLLATAHQSLQLQFAVLQDNIDRGDAMNVVARILSIIAVALPPLSAAYLLTRVTHRTSRRMWNAAGKYPAAQGALAVGFGSVVAFAAMSLWPGGQYEPVQAGERAAAGDGFAIVPSRLITSIQPDVVEAAFPAAERLEGRRHTVPTTARRTPTATTATTAPALVDLAAREPSITDQTPPRPAASSTGAAARSRWPFPFDPPPRPRAQDNFALAVNTTDARHVADVSADFHWLGEARVDHRNRSYAIAQCVDCTTIAGAFQVVVASDESRTVIPENSAVSVNHECTSCITHSVAVQLVVTTFETPPDSVRRAVHARYREVKALERRATTISSGELRAAFLDAKADMLALLAPYSVRTESDTDTEGDQVTPSSPTDESTTTSTTDEPTSTTSTSSTSTTPTSTTSTTSSTSTTSTTTATDGQEEDNTSSTSTSPSTTSTTVPSEQTATSTETTASG